jgi:hypothetical protein
MSEIRCDRGHAARRTPLGDWVCDTCQVKVVTDLKGQKYKRMVLSAFDRMERAEKREERVHKSEVERAARKRW